MTTLDINAVALTAAAISAGFHEHKDAPDVDYDRIGGGTGLFYLLASYAVEIETRWQITSANGERSGSGVWDYEVAEEFGAWLRTMSVPDEDDAIKKMDELVADYWIEAGDR